MGVSIRPSDFVIDEDDRVYSDYENTAAGEILKTCINCKHYLAKTRDADWHICLLGKTKIINDPMVEVCRHYKQKKRVKPFLLLNLSCKGVNYE